MLWKIATILLAITVFYMWNKMRRQEAPVQQQQPARVTRQAVEDVNLGTLQQRLKNGRNSFVLFYSQSCGYCHQMMPEFDKFGSMAKDQVLKIDLSKGENDEAHEIFEITGYPTVKYFDAQRGTVGEYTGELTVEGFKQFTN